MDQADEAVRDGDRDTGPDLDTSARRELRLLRRHQIGAGVTRMRVRRQRKVRVDPANLDDYVGQGSIPHTDTASGGAYPAILPRLSTEARRTLRG
jgi:hypothetical protein